MEIYNEPIWEKFEINDTDICIRDPFIREFLAFCKINGMESRAVELLNKRIKELKKASS